MSNGSIGSGWSRIVVQGVTLYALAYGPGHYPETPMPGEKGTVAMANSGPNTNGSQFFIMHMDYPLPPSYTKFGKVIEGQDVVNTIASVQTNQNDKPLEPIVMNKVYIQGE